MRWPTTPPVEGQKALDLVGEGLNWTMANIYHEILYLRDEQGVEEMEGIKITDDVLEDVVWYLGDQEEINSKISRAIEKAVIFIKEDRAGKGGFKL